MILVEKVYMGSERNVQRGWSVNNVQIPPSLLMNETHFSLLKKSCAVPSSWAYVSNRVRALSKIYMVKPISLRNESKTSSSLYFSGVFLCTSPSLQLSDSSSKVGETKTSPSPFPLLALRQQHSRDPQLPSAAGRISVSVRVGSIVEVWA